MVNSCAETDGNYIYDVSCNKNARRYICEKKSKNIILTSKHNYQEKKCFANERWSNKLKECVACPHNWLLLDDGCFFVSLKTNTWANAQSNCEARNGTLFNTESKVVIDVLATIFRIYNLGSENFWVKY